jgi:hypothetical protein
VNHMVIEISRRDLHAQATETKRGEGEGSDSDSDSSSGSGSDSDSSSGSGSGSSSSSGSAAVFCCLLFVVGCRRLSVVYCLLSNSSFLISAVCRLLLSDSVVIMETL